MNLIIVLLTKSRRNIKRSQFFFICISDICWPTTEDRKITIIPKGSRNPASHPQRIRRNPFRNTFTKIMISLQLLRGTFELSAVTWLCVPIFFNVIFFLNFVRGLTFDLSGCGLELVFSVYLSWNIILYN